VADTLTDLLRDELLLARRAGDRAVAAALRTTLAALSNAEALPVDERPVSGGSEHIAGARLGVGAAEAARRELTDADRHRVVRAEIASIEDAARIYDGPDPGRAEEARRGAIRLVGILDQLGTAQ